MREMIETRNYLGYNESVDYPIRMSENHAYLISGERCRMDLSFINISKYSKVPLHEQLRESIVKAIHSGILKADDKLPTEDELCRAFDISRIVVRQSYNDLLKDGLIARGRGRGSFVKKMDDNGLFMHHILSFREEMSILNRNPYVDVIKAEKITYDASIFEELGLVETDSCFLLKRVRYADGKPYTYIENYVRIDRFPNLETYDFSLHSLYDVLQTDYETKPSLAKRSIGAMKADADMAAYLGVKKNAAVLIVKSVVYDQYDRLIEISKEYVAGDSHRYDFEVRNT